MKFYPKDATFTSYIYKRIKVVFETYIDEEFVTHLANGGNYENFVLTDLPLYSELNEAVKWSQHFKNRCRRFWRDNKGQGFEAEIPERVLFWYQWYVKNLDELNYRKYGKRNQEETDDEEEDFSGDQ